MCFRWFFSFCDMQNLHRRPRSLVTFGGGMSRTCHSNSSEHTIEVTGIDIKPAYCSGRPQLDDRPVATSLDTPQFNSQTLTSHGRCCADGFPSRHKERRSDQIALSDSLQAVCENARSVRRVRCRIAREYYLCEQKVERLCEKFIGYGQDCTAQRGARQL